MLPAADAMPTRLLATPHHVRAQLGIVLAHDVGPSSTIADSLSRRIIASEQEARAYAHSHPEHVAQREFRRVRTNGSYRYSAHDSSWVDFLRQSHMIDSESLDAVGRSYWQGVSVRDCQLQSMGQPWTQERVSEVLFEGRIDFYDRSLPDSPSGEATEPVSP